MTSAFVWNSFAIVPLAGLLIQVLLFAIVLRKNAGWILSKLFVLGLFMTIIWNIGESVLTLTSPDSIESTGYFWAKFEWIGVPLASAAGLHLCLASRRYYTDSEPLHPNDFLLYIPSIFFVLLIVATDDIVLGATGGPWRPAHVLQDSVWTVALAIHNTLFAILAIYILYRARKEARGPKSNMELKWFFLGYLIPTAFIAILRLITTELLDAPTIYPTFFSVGLVLNGLCLTYAIVKYQLFDIKFRVYIRRAMVYSVAFVLAAIAYSAVVFVLLFLVTESFLANQTSFYIGILFPIFLLSRQWNLGGTVIVETLVPSLKWKESKIANVFLVHQSGLLITQIRAESRIRVDESLMVGMLTSIQNFVETALENPERNGKDHLNILTYGDTKLMIEHGAQCYMVVVFDGFELDEMRSDVKKTLGEIDTRYSNVLREWDGDTTVGENIRPIIQSMLGVGTAPA